MNPPTLHDLYARIRVATIALETECKRRWPEGSRVRWLRNRFQKSPSEGIVTWHSGEEIGVKYEITHRHRGRETRFKRVRWTQICE